MEFTLKKDELLLYICVLISGIFFFIGNIFYSNELILISILFLSVGNIIFSFFNRCIYFSFNITFFTFIVCRPIVKILSNFHDSYNDTLYGLDFFNASVTSNIFQVVYIALLGLTLGYLLFENKMIDQWKPIPISKKKNFNLNLRFISKYLYYITFIFVVLITLERAKYTNVEGYYSLYSSYHSDYPYLFTKFSEMNQILFFLFLGTLPPKKETIVPVFSYFLIGCLSLLVGQRNIFVLNILIIFIYLCFRSISDVKERWLTKRMIIFGLAFVPFLIVLLNFVNKFRLRGIDSSVDNGFLSFFYSQGVSINLIGHAENLKNTTDKGWEFFTFGRIIDFFNNNSISKYLFDLKTYSSQTLDSAIYGHSFADTISYMISPSRYLEGWGYGSSYLAEVYYDFGKLGIFIYNFFLSYILIFMKKLFNKGPITIAFALSMVRLLLYSPRDTALSFLVSTFNIVNVLTVILVYFISSMLTKPQHNSLTSQI